MKYILALDQGTTSSRAILLNHRAQIVSLEQLEFPQHYPQPGWVEHDAMDIWRTQLACAQNCLRKAGVSASEVSAIGVTNQRETTVVWDRTTGLPIAPAIVWQDRRTAPYCTELQRRGFEVLVREKTGLRIDPYFSATKIRWILDRVSGTRRTRLRHDRHVAHLEAHGRPRLRDRHHERLPHDALQSRNLQVG